MTRQIHKRASCFAHGSPRCLWIGRYIPYPINEGMKLYSAKVIESFAASGVTVCAMGFGDAQLAPRTTHLTWDAVPGERGRDLGGIVNRLPLAAAVDATPAYRALLDAKLHEDWDVIVLDSYASGWALDRCRRYRATRNEDVLLVHVSHNHEAAVWRSMARHSCASSVHRWLLKRNAGKVEQLEQELLNTVDLVTTITEEDSTALGKGSHAAEWLTLMPGFDGAMAHRRTITSQTPRRVVIVGSFHWIVKRENLMRFVQHADPIFSQHGIQLIVAGSMPSELQQALQASCRSTRFCGFVNDLLPLLSEARIALVPELIGGGFKLKFLDYFFARIPVATVTAAASGVPPSIREHLLMGDDIEALTHRILESIDDVQDLNRRHAAVSEKAPALFSWKDRGLALRARIETLQVSRQAQETRLLVGS